MKHTGRMLPVFALPLGIALLLIGCTPPGTVSPMPTSMPEVTAANGGEQTPAATDRPADTPEPAPTQKPAEPTDVISPTPSASPTLSPLLVVADFNSCTKTNSLGFSTGVAFTTTHQSALTYAVDEEGGNCFARLDYEINDWGAFGLRLGDVENGPLLDLRPYGTVGFKIRAPDPASAPTWVKIELKKECVQLPDRLDCAQAAARRTRLSFDGQGGWHTVEVRLDQFGPTGFQDMIATWDAIAELSIVFELDDLPATTGTVELDDIYFRMAEGQAGQAGEGLLVSDFTSCMLVNNLGGLMGTAAHPKDRLDVSMLEEGDKGCTLRLEYRMKEWTAFWIQLNRERLTTQECLAFEIKAEPLGEDLPFVEGIKVELAGDCRKGHCNIRSIRNLSERIAGAWQTIMIALDSFISTDYALGIMDKGLIEQVIFTFEFQKVGYSDVILLDNVRFLERCNP